MTPTIALQQSQRATSTLTTIGVVGAGRTGLGLGALWAGLGHAVLIGNCKGSARLSPVLEDAPDRFESVAPAEIAERADVVLLGAAARQLPGYLAALGSLAGKIVIDPFAEHQRGEDGRSLSDLVAERLPDARIVRAFSGVEWTFDALADFRSPWEREAVELAGDDAEAKAVVAGLIGALGLVPRDLGALANAGRARALAHLPAYGVRLHAV